MKQTPATTDANIAAELTFEPLTSRNWTKFTELFGDRGACGNCWCMYFRLRKDDFVAGVSVAMLKGVIAYARTQNIRIIEAYPTIPTKPALPDSFAWIGLYRSFERAGFKIRSYIQKQAHGAVLPLTGLGLFAWVAFLRFIVVERPGVYKAAFCAIAAALSILFSVFPVAFIGFAMFAVAHKVVLAFR